MVLMVGRVAWCCIDAVPWRKCRSCTSIAQAEMRVRAYGTVIATVTDSPVLLPITTATESSQLASPIVLIGTVLCHRLYGFS